MHDKWTCALAAYKRERSNEIKLYALLVRKGATGPVDVAITYRKRLCQAATLFNDHDAAPDTGNAVEDYTVWNPRSLL